ncbi:MAG TPA: hypothetical protein VHD69_01985 [Candidatus Paceibacterota bacterium]|nr:hypothetical protein [Candidatus Paceibacterota bacterium]
MKRLNLHLNSLGKDPATDWYVALGCLAFGLVIVGVIDFCLYRSLLSESDVITASSAPHTALDRTDIDAVAKELHARESGSAAAAARSIPDPSI